MSVYIGTFSIDWIVGLLTGLWAGLNIPRWWEAYQRSKHGTHCEWCDNEIDKNLILSTKYGLKTVYFDDAICLKRWWLKQAEEMH